MGRLKAICLFAASASLIAQSASAQSLRDWQLEGQGETRASASITIPLGARRGSADSKPRLDFSFEAQALGVPQSVTPMRFEEDLDRARIQATTVSFTLEQNPRLLMNGQRVATFGPTLHADEEGEDESGGGISTLGWIGIGVGALAGLSLWAGLEVRDDLQDAFGDPD